MKASAPKRSKQSKLPPIPMRPVYFFFSFIHWFMKMVTNMAVMTKSSPSVLNFRREPIRPPSVAPETQ